MPNILYATDEDIALRAPADFALLCPRDQAVAAAGDGAFDPSDRWTLTSSSVNFAAHGVAPGQVVQLLGPPAIYRPPGDGLVVAGVSGYSATLRRKGQVAGAGHPPGPLSGAFGVEFLIATLAPQIERAALDLDGRFGIAGRSDLADPLELRDAVVLTVLHRQYLALSRDAGGDHADAMAAKARSIKAELDELLARVVVHRRAGDDAVTRFSTRLSR